MDEARVSSRSDARGTPSPRRPAWWLPILLFLQVFPTLALAATEPLSLLVLLSHSATPYERVASTIRDGTTDLAVTIDVRTLEELGTKPPRSTPDLIVTIGTRAGRRALARWPDRPVLSTLIPSRLFKGLAAEHRERADTGRLSAIFLDQPLERQFRFLCALLPESRSVGVLFGQESVEASRELERLARDAGLVLHALDGRRDKLPRTIRRLARISDVILALPDRSVMTPNHAKWLLYIAYRHRTPVVGFSRHYVEAGALAAIYTSPEQIGRQTVDAIADYIESPPDRRRLPPPVFPETFSISINRHVARSLEIDLPPEAALHELTRAPGSSKPGGRR